MTLSEALILFLWMAIFYVIIVWCIKKLTLPSMEVLPQETTKERLARITKEVEEEFVEPEEGTPAADALRSLKFTLDQSYPDRDMSSTQQPWLQGGNVCGPPTVSMADVEVTLKVAINQLKEHRRRSFTPVFINSLNSPPLWIPTWPSERPLNLPMKEAKLVQESLNTFKCTNLAEFCQLLSMLDLNFVGRKVLSQICHKELMEVNKHIAACVFNGECINELVLIKISLEVKHSVLDNTSKVDPEVIEFMALLDHQEVVEKVSAFVHSHFGFDGPETAAEELNKTRVWKM